VLLQKNVELCNTYRDAIIYMAFLLHKYSEKGKLNEIHNFP